MDHDFFENELNIRAILRKKIASGEKLTSEEIYWSETHREFSAIFGYPILKKDIIELGKETKYRFRVIFLDSTHSLMIAPCFKAPFEEGEITTDREMYSYSGKKSKYKSVKMLVTDINREKPEFVFYYQSKTGALCVTFRCEYIDTIQHLRLRGGSDFGEGRYMIRKDVGKNRVVYQCKSEGANEFDSLSFLVEWEIID